MNIVLNVVLILRYVNNNKKRIFIKIEEKIL